MHARKPEGESEARRKERNVSPGTSNLLRKRFVLVASVLGTGADGDVEVLSRSVVLDVWSESDADAKHQFEDWMDAQLDSGGEVPEEDEGRFHPDDPWEGDF